MVEVANEKRYKAKNTDTNDDDDDFFVGVVALVFYNTNTKKANALSESFLFSPIKNKFQADIY